MLEGGLQEGGEVRGEEENGGKGGKRRSGRRGMGRYRDRQEVLRRGLDRNQNGKKNGDEEQDDRITINKILNT